MQFRTVLHRGILVACLVVSCLFVPEGFGQSKCANSTDVGCVIPNMFGASGTTGITLPTGFHQAHFLDPQHFTENFLPLNTAVATQLTLLPQPSPASGFVYELDRGTGLRTPKAETLGPILTERGETIGARKLFLGFAYQRFRFDEIDGNKLDSLPVVFTHEANTGPGGTQPPYEQDVITATNGFELKINQYTMYGSFGLTDRLDVSAAIPIMDVGLTATSLAKIVRVTGALCGPPGQVPTSPCHAFNLADPVNSTAAVFRNTSSARGLGDISTRIKYNIFSAANMSAAVLTDLRFPTGDEQNFLGSGAVGVKPFLAVSWNRGPITPHVNVGYQWNGKSVLAGNLSTGAEASLPDQFFYSFGTEVRASNSVTISGDLVGQRLFDGTRVATGTVNSYGLTYPSLTFPVNNFSITNASIGAKFAFRNRILFTGNALISLDDGGLRQAVTPLAGVSFLF
jgi:hypothetical protein